MRVCACPSGAHMRAQVASSVLHVHLPPYMVPVQQFIAQPPQPFYQFLDEGHPVGVACLGGSNVRGQGVCAPRSRFRRMWCLFSSRDGLLGCEERPSGIVRVCTAPPSHVLCSVVQLSLAIYGPPGGSYFGPGVCQSQWS